ncbi:MAG: glycosyltransferase family 39 protein [Bacteroidetes bacterium]|nr:glycosyltransferase family 39 protein [Bacteroidota bacterium]
MSRQYAIHVWITLLAALLYIPFLGSFHLFDWDEINFAEAAREMIVSGDYSRVQIAFEPFWEKPPLFIWMQVLCMKLFGVGEFAARLPNALFGILTLNMIYAIGRKQQGHFFALFWVVAYAGSLAPTLYFKTGIMDPVFNLFIFLSIYQWFLAEKSAMESQRPRIHFFMAGLFISLALLIKGPAALLILGCVACVRWILNDRYAWPGFGNLFLFFISSCLFPAIWLAVDYSTHGSWFLQSFFEYQMVLVKGQIAWHNQPWYYHIVVLWILCFPAFFLALPHLIGSGGLSRSQSLLHSYMRALFWVVLVIFSIVSTKIIHYSSLCWIPLTYFAAYTVYRFHTGRGKIPRWTGIPGLLAWLILYVVLCTLPLFMTGILNPDQVYPYIHDRFAIAILKSSASWPWWSLIPGALLAVGGFVWLFRFFGGRNPHPAWLFAITGIASHLVYICILPSTENTLQGAFIREIQSQTKPRVYVEAWHFKTYATYFYGNQHVSRFKGPWGNGDANSGEPNPRTMARMKWLMDKENERKVFIFTRIDYKPDQQFRSRFQPVKPVGGYQLWQAATPTAN